MEREEYTFDGQRKGEKVVAVVQNHPIVLFIPGIKATIVFLASVSALLYFGGNQYAGLVAFVLFVIGAGLFGRSYFVFSHSNLVITSQRIIYTDQRGFWAQRIIETEISNIQDAASDTKGVSRTMLKFGNLTIRTSGAAQGSEIVVRDIPNPYEVQQVIAGLK